jgi:phenol hydroxylase P4 protein
VFSGRNTAQEILMSVIALKPGYQGKVRDAKDQYDGQHVLFVEWNGHLSISAPIAVLVDPEQKFQDFIENQLTQSVFASHSDWAEIDWSNVEWIFERQPLQFDEQSSFNSLGIGHKSYLRFHTPHLNGI